MEGVRVLAKAAKPNNLLVLVTSMGRNAKEKSKIKQEKTHWETTDIDCLVLRVDNLLHANWLIQEVLREAIHIVGLRNSYFLVNLCVRSTCFLI